MIKTKSPVDDIEAEFIRSDEFWKTREASL